MAGPVARVPGLGTMLVTDDDHAGFHGSVAAPNSAGALAAVPPFVPVQLPRRVDRRNPARYTGAMFMRCFALAGTVAAVCLIPPAVRAQAPAAPATHLTVPYQEFTLANGLHVILHRDASVPVVAVNVWYHVGSGNEKLGRTGFAHLFEHLMFEGSKHVPEGAFDTWLEGAGANNNGSTNTDRTNYYIDGPANALELMLFLDSDRMGYLLDTMSPERVDGQRDVVKNERRQSYENRPYGMAELELDTLLWPKGHPYSWSTIGSMEDLSAASHEDVQEFFRTYYAPNNASLVIAGDIDFGDDEEPGGEMVQRRAGRQAGAAGGAARGDAHQRDAQDGHRSGAAAAAVPGVADPGV